MKRIALAVVASLGLALGSGTALAQHRGGGHDAGAWHGGGGHGDWRGGHGGWQGGHDWHGGWHGGTRIGIGIGFPGFYWGPGWGYPYYAGYPYYSSYPYYAGSPYYYAAEPVYVEPGPITYIQRDMSGGAQGDEGQYSYYCRDPAGYYPQVANCPNGWLKVVPDGSPRPRTR
jgi:hypothetical protein